jgi:hypothetical protein
MSCFGGGWMVLCFEKKKYRMYKSQDATADEAKRKDGQLPKRKQRRIKNKKTSN